MEVIRFTSNCRQVIRRAYRPASRSMTEAGMAHWHGMAEDDSRNSSIERGGFYFAFPV